MTTPNFNPSQLTSFFEEKWHEKAGLFAVLLTLNFACIASLDEASIKSAAALILLNGLVIALWHYSNKLPATPQGQIGFIVCLNCPEEIEARKVREDFIQPLKSLLGYTKLGENICFIETPSWKANRTTTLKEAEELRSAAKAHFIVYGYVRRRTLHGKDQHIIELHGIVTHASIPNHISTRIATEFGELFPNKVHIEAENDTVNFEFTSKWTAVVAHYIIGIAAAVSGDIAYAEAMYHETARLLNLMSSEFPIYQEMKKRVPQRLEEIQIARTRIAYSNWELHKTPENADALYALSQTIGNSKHSIDPVTANLKAIADFLKTSSTQKALHFLERSEIKDSTWRLNVAFLKAFEGDMKAAIRLYRTAAKSDIPQDVPATVETFICWVITSNPDALQLRYLLAQFNLIIKNDKALAKEDFRMFLESCPPDKFLKEQEIARKAIATDDPPLGLAA